jgi:asparagine synthase (glutamine-hydrolysing)
VCGIAGFLNFDRAAFCSQKILKAMTDILIHRGPDGSGYWTKGPVALGHRRLAIIDLNSGQQPMFYNQGRLCITLNGEIYNYIEIREELLGKGYKFITNSDTEVILAAYAEWGTDCVSHFNGMWAFALWDDSNQRLFCSRDRLGEKPFYYTVTNNTFVFASELKSIFVHGVPKIINEEMLDTYLCFTYIPAPYTFYKNIYKLRPGHSLIVENGTIRTLNYWDVEFVSEKDSIKDEKQIFTTFEALFNDAVRLRMRSDVPFGAFLSGGLDSSSIVSVMSRMTDLSVRTFTIGFSERQYDERPLARLVAGKFLTDHRERIVVPEDMSTLIETLAFCFDEPFGDSSALPTYLVSRMAREEVTMVLTGDGGDEVLSGYTIYQGERFSQQYQKWPLFLRKRLPLFIDWANRIIPDSFKAITERAITVLSASNLEFIDRLEQKQTGLNKDWRRRLLDPQNGNAVSAKEFIENTLLPVKALDNFGKLNYWLTKISLPDDMLCKVDRASMANSLETRLPFLDFHLVEYMASVSMNVKLKGYTRKNILRRTLGKKLPRELMKASKKGFCIPLSMWTKSGECIDRILAENICKAAKNGIIREQAVLDLLTESKRTGAILPNALWSLSMLRYV